MGRRLPSASLPWPRGRSRAARRAGKGLEPVLDRPRLGLSLWWDPRRARRRMPVVQRRMAAFLLREQVGWCLRATGADCVLDVGANTGQFGRALRAAGYRGRIVSFEPDPAAYRRLARRARRDPDWRVEPFALGAADGTRVLHRAEGSVLSSLLPPSEFGRRWARPLRADAPHPVAVRRLDGLYDELVAGLSGDRTFLKLDTQGYDLEAFRGAAGIHDRLVGLQSELSLLPLYDGMPRLPEQLAEYEAAGFETAGVFQVAREVRTLRLIEVDVVMVRADRVHAGRAG